MLKIAVSLSCCQLMPAMLQNWWVGSNPIPSQYENSVGACHFGGRGLHGITGFLQSSQERFPKTIEGILGFFSKH